ncbi:hypothetical protein ACFHWD_03375 [Clostridium sp. MT-14]|uniref:hypothetical protein n=1 Tax=Clostridium sp. MT-14 TaxID=3348360 RepID=UPI0035F336BA
MDGTQIVNTLGKAIDMLAKKMSIPANKLYEVMQGQLKFDIYKMSEHLIIFIVLLILDIVLTRKIIKSLRTEDGYFYEDQKFEDGIITSFSFVGIVILAIICIVGIFMDINTIVQINVSPGYYIFKEYIQPLIQ